MKRILIIEDDPLTARIYSSCLDKAGYDVQVITDGQSAFNRIAELKPDGILMDLMLPHVNGVELLKKIRAVDSFQKLPVIAFTNAFVPTMIQQLQAAGANQVFDKISLTPSVLLASFQSLLAAPA